VALDFPNSPSNGEIYEGFVYDSTSQSWRVRPDSPTILVDYLVVGGGGSGGGGNGWRGGGGGAGGYRCSVTGELTGGGGSAEPKLATRIGDSLDVEVGAGGVWGNTSAQHGGRSRFGNIIAQGGGSGSRYDGSNYTVGGCNAGSGDNHGKGYYFLAEGFDGGISNQGAGGGGGAGAVGANGTTGYVAGAGGAGLSSSITGSAVTRAVGGGGAGYSQTAPAANSGSGGVGSQGTGQSGGSGVVIIRYTGSSPLTVGGSLTYTSSTVGSDTVYTFTAGTGTVTF